MKNIIEVVRPQAKCRKRYLRAQHKCLLEIADFLSSLAKILTTLIKNNAKENVKNVLTSDYKMLEYAND